MNRCVIEVDVRLINAEIDESNDDHKYDLTIFNDRGELSVKFLGDDIWYEIAEQEFDLTLSDSENIERQLRHLIRIVLGDINAIRLLGKTTGKQLHDKLNEEPGITGGYS